MLRGISFSISACVGMAFLLFGCSCFALGAFMTFFVSEGTEEEAQEIAELPAFADGTDTSQVYATGALEGNSTAKEAFELDDIAHYELVGYQISEWNVTRSRSGGSSRNNTGARYTYRGSWRVLETFLPQEMTLALGAEELTIRPNESIIWDAAEHEVIEPGDGNGYSDTYNGQPLEDGSIRVLGFKNGDTVTFIGERQGDTLVNASRIYGGTREELVASMEASVQVFRWMGVGMMICGPMMVLPALFISGLVGFASLLGRRSATA